MKRGAMFGLDARIALAIFGTLSVIGGVALYSSIEESKVTRIITEMNEIGKAFEQYYLDTGITLSVKDPSNSASDDFYRYIAKDLVENPGVFNWRGPYLEYNVLGDNITGSFYTTMQIYLINDLDTWGGSVLNWTDGGPCNAGQKCYAWVINTGIDSISLVKALDKKIDGSDGGDKGNFKFYYVNDESKYRLFFKYIAMKNPND